MATRDRIFTRDCGICQQCHRQGRITIATQIDHIIALSNGGSNADDNLEAICEPCHTIKTDADLGHKPTVTTGLDGWPAQDAYKGALWQRRGYK